MDEMRIIDETENEVMKFCKLNDIKYERTEDYFVDLFGEVKKDEGMNNYDFDSIVLSEEAGKPSVIGLPDIRSVPITSKDFQPAELHGIKKLLGFGKEIALEGNLRKRAGIIVKGLGDHPRPRNVFNVSMPDEHRQLELFTEDVYRDGYRQRLADFQAVILEYLWKTNNNGQKCIKVKHLEEGKIAKIKDQILKMKGYNETN